MKIEEFKTVLILSYDSFNFDHRATKNFFKNCVFFFLLLLCNRFRFNECTQCVFVHMVRENSFQQNFKVEQNSRLLISGPRTIEISREHVNPKTGLKTFQPAYWHSYKMYTLATAVILKRGKAVLLFFRFRVKHVE